MIIEKTVLINATIDTVWDTFTDLTCWKDWCSVMEDVTSHTGHLTEGKRFKFCIRPFNFPLNIEPRVEEMLFQKRIVWSGKKHGVSARHEFTFTQQHDGVLLTSRETFSGAVLKFSRFLFPREKLQKLTLSMLHDLKDAAESESSTRIPAQD